MENLQQKILDIMKKHSIGTMATLHGEQPYVRYMTFKNEDFTLYTTTSEESHKMEDLAINPYTHILLGYTKEDMNAPYLEISAKLTEIQDVTMIKKISEFFADLFSSNDSQMITLQLDPMTITLMNDGEPQQITF